MPPKESKTLDQLYYDEIKDLYDAEHRIVKTLPKLAKAASSDELREAFTEHLEQTQGHIERLEQVFESMGKPAKAKTCDGIKGIIEEGSETLELKGGPAKDAGLIAGAQRVEHYEMAAYGTVRTWAKQLGKDDEAQLLQKTLDEEKEADQKLSEIAESSINAEAEEDSDDEEGGEDEETDEEEDEEEVQSRPKKKIVRSASNLHHSAVGPISSFRELLAPRIYGGGRVRFLHLGLRPLREEKGIFTACAWSRNAPTREGSFSPPVEDVHAGSIARSTLLR